MGRYFTSLILGLSSFALLTILVGGSAPPADESNDKPPPEFEWSGPPDLDPGRFDRLIRAYCKLAGELAPLGPTQIDQEARWGPLKIWATTIRERRDALNDLAEEKPERYMELLDEYRERLDLAESQLHEQLERISRAGGGRLGGELTDILYDRWQLPITLRRVYRGASLTPEETTVSKLVRFNIETPGDNMVLMLREGLTPGILFGTTAHPETQSIYLVLPANVRAGDRFSLSIEEETLAMHGHRRSGYAIHDPHHEARAEVEILRTPLANIEARLDVSVPVIYGKHFATDDELVMRSYETITYRGVYSFAPRPQ